MPEAARAVSWTHYLFLLLCFLLGSFVAAQDTAAVEGASAAIVAEVESLQVGQRMQGRIVIAWDDEVYDPLAMERPEKLGAFEVLEWKVSKQRENAQGWQERTVSFEAAVFALGEQPLGPYVVDLSRQSGTTQTPDEPAQLSAPALTVQVESFLAGIEQESGQTIELAAPVKAPLELEPDYRWVWWLAGALLAALLLGLVLVWLVWRVVKKRRMRTGMAPQPLLLDPETEALAALDALGSGGAVEQMSAKQYYGELSYILRRFLERKHRFEALEMTSSEILEVVEKIGWPMDLLEQVREQMSESDAAKFARHEPSLARRRTALDSVRDVVLRSRSLSTTDFPTADAEVLDVSEAMVGEGGVRGDA